MEKILDLIIMLSKGLGEFFVFMLSEYYKTLTYIIGCVIIISHAPDMDMWIDTGIALLVWAFFKSFEDHY